MPLVIPVFIPHEGCPHRCVFCNQNRISGQAAQVRVHGADVREQIETWLGYSGKKNGERREVAFYGGSFTALPHTRQEELLGAVRPFLVSGAVGSIRLSTRPDAITPGIVSFLRGRGVTLVELGVQSMDDELLALAGRGHSARQVREAVGVLRDGELAVGVQLMIGLPGETRKSLRRTVKQVLALRPDCVRLYPVLILEGSQLAGFYRQGSYRPLSLAAAVALVAWMKERFGAQNIPVIRMGLQPGSELEKALLAGPYHPAFGEMVLSRLMFRRTRALLAGVVPGRRVTLSIAQKDLSVFQGVGSCNSRRLRELGLLEKFSLVADPRQARNTVTISD
jgi:histone acetyltransferase (RNA polymerase elongator complex component)